MNSITSKTRLVFITVAGLFSCVSCSGQDFDGLVRKPQQLLGQPAVIAPKRGTIAPGSLTQVLQPKDNPLTIVHFEVKTTSGRTRRFKPEQIHAIRIGNREMRLLAHLPSRTHQLVDVWHANEEIDARLNELKRRRTALYEQKDHDRLSKSALDDIRESVEKLSVGKEIGISSGKHVILVTDYPARQRPTLLKSVDPFVPRLNEVFGFREDDLVLPGKPIVAVFASRDNLGVFQHEVANNPNYGSIRAFFHLVDGHVVVTAEDERSPKNTLWQAAWGLSGAYAHFSYSNVVLPAWIRVGLQQHSADLLVPGLSNYVRERKTVTREIEGGTLNGLFGANRLPLDRQLICKLIVAHLYKTHPEAFGQTLNLLKLGRTTEDVLSICYGTNDKQLARSFGRTVGIPQLTP